MTIWHNPFVRFSLVVLLFATRNALALDPSLHLTQYRHATWRVQYGLLPATPQWISQTPDGYLLVGIPPMGAYQFDGVRLTPWLPPVAPSNDIYDVLPAKGGGFWFIEARGVTHVFGKRVISHFNLRGAPSSLAGNHVVEDVDGSLWLVLEVVVDSGGPLCHITDLAARCFGAAAGMPFSRADSIISDGKGGFWIGTDTALVHWQANKHEIYGVKALRSNAGQDGISSLVLDAGGFLWVGIDKTGPDLGLETFDGHEFRPFVTPTFDGRTVEVLAMHKDRDQNLWVATNTGIYRIHGEAVDHLEAADGLTGDTVNGLYEDREGTIWAPTSGGLDSFSESRITSFSHTEGLSSDTVYSVLASRDGTLWLAEDGSLDRLRNGVVSSIRPADGLPGEQVTSLLQDHAGRIWVGVDDGLFLYDQHKFRPVLGPDHRPLGLIAGITEDVAGNIWVECASNPRKLVRIRNFKVQEELSSSQVPAGHTLAADPRGGIWVSTLDGNLVLLQHGAPKTFRLNINGEVPRQIEAEPDGSVLVASPEEGLVGMRMGKVQRLTKKNGLPCTGVFGLAWDDSRVLWLEAPCGYIAIADSEVRQWWARSDAVVQYRLYDHLDGARPLLANFNPAAKSPDGHLWFAAEALQTFDPRHLLSDQAQPPARIEQIIADHKTYDIDPDAKVNMILPARIQELEIDYTALSLAVPEKTLFRYRLDGFDHDWHDVGRRRQALYTNLPPGSYRFRVSASNDGRVWNGTGADLDFSIAHAWYQTSWFRAACVAVFLGIVWALYRLRMGQIGREKNLHQEMQTALAHANRLSAMGQVTASIAHEVKSPITGTVINAETALKTLRTDTPDLEKVRQALTRIVRDSNRAVQIVDDARSMARQAPATQDDVALNAAIAEVMDMTRWQAIKYGISMRAQLADDLPTIPGDRVQLQQVVLNLINNAIEAMSGSSEGMRELLIRTEARNGAEILVIVADSGPGLTPAVLTRLFQPFQTTKPDGLGLGLSICRSIVEAHGGQLSARANAPRGAIFQFSVRAGPIHDRH